MENSNFYSITHSGLPILQSDSGSKNDQNEEGEMNVGATSINAREYLLL